MSEPTLTIQLLGGFKLGITTASNGSLTPGLATRVLALLVLNPDRLIPRDEILELLWPEEDPDVTRPRLRQVLHQVRKLLADAGGKEDLLASNSATVQLCSDGVETDVSEFETCLALASDGRPIDERIALLEEADRLWRGELLPAFYDDFVVARRAELSEAHREGLLALARACEGIDRWDCALAAARRLVGLDPLMEEAHCALMRAYAATGQPGAAVRQFHEMERLTREELGAEPSESAFRLLESVRRSVRTPLPSPLTVRPVIASTHGTPQHTRFQLKTLLPYVVAITGIGIVGISFWLSANRRHRVNHLTSKPGYVTYPSAVQLWEARYSPGPGDHDSEPSAIAVTASNENVQGAAYVTGFIQTDAHDVDFITLKFKPPSTKAVWEKRFNGLSDDVDWARSIDVDRMGNVYVAGESASQEGNGMTRHCGLDIVTIKYDRNGDYSSSWPDLGDGKGVRRYNGPADGEERATKVKVDASGNVYVLGSSWSKRGKDIVLIKYSATGDQLWKRRYGDTTLDDDARDMVLDEWGNIYVCGAVQTRNGIGKVESDWVILKFSPDGGRQWHPHWGHDNGLDDRPNSMAVSERGYIAVAGEGYVGRPDSRLDSIVSTYNPGGVLHGMASIALPGDGTDRAVATAYVRDSPELYVTGESAGTDIRQVVTSKLNAGAGEVWRNTFRGVAIPKWPAEAAPKALGVNSSGYPTVCGGATRLLGSFSDAFTIRYTPDGKVHWLGVYDGPAHGGDVALAIALSEAGISFVACQSAGGKTNDIVVLLYGNDPDPKRRYSFPLPP